MTNLEIIQLTDFLTNILNWAISCHYIGQAKWIISCWYLFTHTGPKVIKLFSCSTQMSKNFIPLINVKMPTMVGILTFMSEKNSILGLYELKKRIS